MEEQAVYNHLLGGGFALTSAALWAGASILWAKLGKNVSSLGMNLGKGLVSLVIFAGIYSFSTIPDLPAKTWLILGMSGIIGISIGDTTYFLALMRLGARRILVLTTLTPVVSSIIGIFLLGEKPSLQWALGAVLCIFGVAWVMWERLPEGSDKGSWKAGIWLGLITVLCEAAGAALSKVGLTGTNTQGPMDATFIRLLFGVAGLLVYGCYHKNVKNWLRPLAKPRLLGVLIAASVIGTFLGIWFAMAALWHTNLILATVLNATSPLFILPMAYIFMKEKITMRSVLGALVAVIGVAILMLYRMI